MNWKYVKFNKFKNIGNIIFNNHKKNNALNIEMRYEFLEILNACNLDNDIKIVVIKSEDKNFCVGADLSEFNTYPSIIESNLISKENTLWKDLYNFNKPIICITQGWVVGSGFEIVLLSDFVFSDQSTIFKMPEVELSITPISGGTQTLLKKTSISVAKEILLFAQPIDVYKAYDYGIVNFYSHEYDLLLKKVDEFSQNIENIELNRIKSVKNLLRASSDENIFLAEQLEKIYSEVN